MQINEAIKKLDVFKGTFRAVEDLEEILKLASKAASDIEKLEKNKQDLIDEI